METKRVDVAPENQHVQVQVPFFQVIISPQVVLFGGWVPLLYPNADLVPTIILGDPDFSTQQGCSKTL